MTTIAWDGTTLAADKQATNGSYKAAVTKIRRLKDGSIAGVCGELEAGILVFDYLDGGPKPVWLDKDDWPVIMIVKPDGTVWRYEKYLIAFQLEEAFSACGSGRDFALAAMALGKTAREAVELAGRFDSSTGVGIDEMRL